MTKVDESAWVPKAKKRKAYRDHHREKFFREVGLTKGAHVQDIAGAPEQQRQFVQDLLALTLRGAVPDGVHKSYIGAVAGAISVAGLGIGGMGGTATNQENLERYSMKALRDGWFWSPAFFD